MVGEWSKKGTTLATAKGFSHHKTQLHESVKRDVRSFDGFKSVIWSLTYSFPRTNGCVFVKNRFDMVNLSRTKK